MNLEEVSNYIGNRMDEFCLNDFDGGNFLMFIVLKLAQELESVGRPLTTEKIDALVRDALTKKIIHGKSRLLD